MGIYDDLDTGALDRLYNRLVGNDPLPLGTRTCWRCHTRTVILWDQRLDRAYCPVCQFTQPPRRHPNTQLQRLAWTQLRAKYQELEGVTVDEQRGIRKDVSHHRNAE